MQVASFYSYTLMQLKEKCKELGISNSAEYRKEYSKHIGFPAHPERTFARDWVSYYDFFDIPDFIDYESLRKLIKPLKIKSQAAYKKFVKEQKDPTFPLTHKLLTLTNGLTGIHF